MSKFALGILALTISAATLPSRAAEAHQGKLSKAKEKYDADGDGMLNEKELARAKEGARAKAKETREANLAKYDANRNGRLDEEERARKRADEHAAKEAKRKEREARKAAGDATPAGSDGEEK